MTLLKHSNGARILGATAGKLSKELTISATIALALFLSTATSVEAKSSHGAEAAKAAQTVKVKSFKRDNKTFVTGRTVIKAPVEIVWTTVHEERKNDPDLEYSKVLEQGKNECRLEQKFVLIPVFGTAVCEMHNSEVPLKRIDYKLIHSDRFKSMEGSWVLTPTEDGRATILELSTHLDLGLPVPRAFMTSVTSKKLSKRLGNVKAAAEHAHRQVAQRAASGMH